MITWEEFKVAVDKKLKEQGISEDTEVSYIDIICEGRACELFDLSLSDNERIVIS